jgi:hypothetical protein
VSIEYRACNSIGHFSVLFAACADVLTVCLIIKMTTYPYILKTDKIKAVFDQIPTTGVPDKFTQKHLESLGHKSPNDRPILPILKFIGFLDSDGTPTTSYISYRGSQRKEVLGTAIKAAYSGLFTLYDNAHQKDDESLYNFFSTHTKLGERALKGVVLTFKALSSLAVFDGTPNLGSTTIAPVASPASASKTSTVSPAPITIGKSHFPVNINIELQIPASTDPAVYENLFKALKTHLFDPDDDR